MFDGIKLSAMHSLELREFKKGERSMRIYPTAITQAPVLRKSNIERSNASRSQDVLSKEASRDIQRLYQNSSPKMREEMSAKMCLDSRKSVMEIRRVSIKKNKKLGVLDR